MYENYVGLEWRDWGNKRRFCKKSARWGGPCYGPTGHTDPRLWVNASWSETRCANICISRPARCRTCSIQDRYLLPLSADKTSSVPNPTSGRPPRQYAACRGVVLMRADWQPINKTIRSPYTAKGLRIYKLRVVRIFERLSVCLTSNQLRDESGRTIIKRIDFTLFN